ncbi:hypothetical protein Q0590_35700 [Rhodocytophaga aerolata]|uniref:Uncharacterized protein n=1 Tax=Rhodocytophaga aerolata TaxID=455078 RepID=A0ABT8RK35_9BACT|nr:hypothetical protein [Rhodocytophaga aerolata]MDO1451673.1 hypothetical protein [Rhodocytophaga aerolata]
MIKGDFIFNGTEQVDKPNSYQQLRLSAHIKKYTQSKHEVTIGVLLNGVKLDSFDSF